MIPLKVSTLISIDFSEDSLKIAAFTLVVNTVSSMYSPVHSLLVVDAHPTTVVITIAKRKAANGLVVNFMVALFISSKPDYIKIFF